MAVQTIVQASGGVCTGLPAAVYKHLGMVTTLQSNTPFSQWRKKMFMNEGGELTFQGRPYAYIPTQPIGHTFPEIYL